MVGLLLAGVLWLAPLPASAQPEGPGDPVGPAAQDHPPKVPFGGMDAFHFVLQVRGFHILQNMQEAESKPSRTLLIILGEEAQRQLDDNLTEGLQAYLDKGGALLLATDQKTAGSLETVLKVRVNGTHIQAADKAHAYRENLDCPLVVNADGIFQGLRVATNVPSYLEDLRFYLPFLGPFPPGWAKFDHAKAPVRNPLFALTFEDMKWSPPGQALVLSDQSVFINGMMLLPGNDNLDFAYRCVDWLTRSAGRDQVLLIEDGYIVSDLRVPPFWIAGALPDLNKPPIPPINPADLPAPPVQVMDQMLAGMEREGVFDKLIYQHLDVDRLLRGLTMLLTGALLVYGLWRWVRSRYRVESDAPLFSASTSGLAPSLALVAQRHKTMLQEGNLWEVARALARQWFFQVGQPPPSPDTAGGRTLEPPRITVQGSWPRRRALRREVLHLWQLAFSETPVRISPPRFTRLTAELDDLQAALAEGTLHLEQPGTNQA
ncbi:MAG: hypothetical protein JO112_19885 [Planctomycetes bacterium]|nr:hypothetical protein [Planctomycetota bacterium]